MNTMTTMRCPSCQKTLRMFVSKMLFLPFSSNLGPPLVECDQCGTIIDSGLKEWPMMSALAKARYYFVTLLYGAIFGMIIGIFLNEDFLRGGHSGLPDSFWITWIAVVLLTFLFQFLRTIVSSRRYEHIQQEVYRTGFFSFRTNMQMAVWIVLFLTVFGLYLIKR